ncbi:MAG: prephenate dehydratase [Candidatus Omnitrophica bacterium]|nr:prephenate dehydratase [Candidatus Omnitrophota bacterium]
MPTIAYLGPENTNTHLAALKKFGRGARYLHAPTVEDVFELVERRRADYGVVPIENSLEGAVTHTLDRFIDFQDTPVEIHGEIEQPIRHCLITHRGVTLGRIATVYSHPQALAQCHRWLTEHLPRAQRRETSSTADAVLDVLTDRAAKRSAAIGRRELAQEHRLEAIPIPEERENKTRFLVLGLGEPRRGARNKTSILFALKDKPGALHDALVPFKKNRINLTKIESRPSKRKAWEYLFFIDLEGRVSEPRVKRALKGLKACTTRFRVLGSYPLTRS